MLKKKTVEGCDWLKKVFCHFSTCYAHTTTTLVCLNFHFTQFFMLWCKYTINTKQKENFLYTEIPKSTFQVYIFSIIVCGTYLFTIHDDVRKTYENAWRFRKIEFFSMSNLFA